MSGVSPHGGSNGPVAFHIVVVSSTRTADTDESGAGIANAVEAAGHHVEGREVVPDDIGRIQEAVRRLAARGKPGVAVLTGGTGFTRSDVTPEALAPLFERTLPGFGELFRQLSYAQVGSSAMMSRATAGTVGPLAVFALPGSPAACALALEKLILPEAGHLVGLLVRDGVPAMAAPVAAPAPIEAVSAEPEAPPAADDQAPVPSGSLGRLGGKLVAVGEAMEAAKPTPTGDVESGWKRAIFEISGEIVRKWPELPEALEIVAPVLNVLDQAGERATLQLADGRTYAIFGFPDLNRPSSKVLAIRSASPVCEVLALHRYPILTGVCCDDPKSSLPTRSSGVGHTCESVTGRAPKDQSGSIYAVQGDAVCIERNQRVVRWDGKSETDLGKPNQALASLLLQWSGR